MFENITKNLERNDFEVFIARNSAEARELVLKKILPEVRAKKISYGDSLTVRSTGIFEILTNDPDLEFIEVFPTDASPDEEAQLRRDALQSDLFFSGTNAVTEEGQLVNLDSLGNRVAGITFGPKHVVIMVGRNKIVPTLDDAIDRVKNIAAPANARRKNKNTPCATTGECEDCSSADRICNIWTITEKSKPVGRIRIVIIDEDLGL
jgi:L-lactate utilization protein LutB